MWGTWSWAGRDTELRGDGHRTGQGGTRSCAGDIKLCRRGYRAMQAGRDTELCGEGYGADRVIRGRGCAVPSLVFRVLVRRLTALEQVCVSLSILAFPSEFSIVCVFQVQGFISSKSIWECPSRTSSESLVCRCKSQNTTQ